MRADQVDIARDVTAARNGSQRLPVTEFRQNGGMPRPPDLPKFDTIGARVKWWRAHRGLTRTELAEKVGMPYSTLSELELGRSKKSERLDLIALHLKVNPLYLRTDKGDPEAPANLIVTDVAPSQWLAQLRELDLDEIEETYFADQAKKALQTIEAARTRKHKKYG